MRRCSAPRTSRRPASCSWARALASAASSTEGPATRSPPNALQGCNKRPAALRRLLWQPWQPPRRPLPTAANDPSRAAARHLAPRHSSARSSTHRSHRPWAPALPRHRSASARSAGSRGRRGTAFRVRRVGGGRLSRPHLGWAAVLLGASIWRVSMCLRGRASLSPALQRASRVHCKDLAEGRREHARSDRPKRVQ